MDKCKLILNAKVRDFKLFFAIKTGLIVHFLVLMFLPISQAQITFSDGSSMLSDTVFYTFLTKGVCDMDGDRLDDIIRISRQGHAYILYQQEDGSFSQDSIGQVSTQTQIATAIGDIDNNGYKDIFTGGAGDGMKIIYCGENQQYEIDTLEVASFLVQGANMHDINQDGLLDLFACNDDGISNIWLQNDDQSYTNQNDYIDMVTTPISNNSGNYSSVWTDIDNDGDTDLYIAKCKALVEDSTDARRINALFINDGNGNYTEEAALRGIASGRQSWTADFGDIDNDGDMDLFIANHGSASELLLNDGQGYFADITNTAQVYDDGKAYQSLFNDFDNDGYLDLLISGFEGFLWKNNGDNTFTRIDCPDPNYGEPMRSFATGDLNNDGFMDIYASYWLGQLNPPIPYDKLWLNEGNANSFCGIILNQSGGNRDAVGGKITLFSAGTQQIREIRSGESYGISNSFIKIFGLGTTATIDSVRVQWPDGVKEQFYDLAINTTHFLERGTGIILSNTILFDAEEVLRIYPNPITDGRIVIELLKPLEDCVLEIYTLDAISSPKATIK